MRSYVLATVLAAVLGVPHASSAQVYQLPTPEPRVTAAHASWRTGGEPVFYEGNYYYPTGPTEFFDGQIMARTGTFRGVPLYENRTLEPFSIVFVPIGRNLMRPYERRRDGDLVGTVGSRMPSFPIQRDVEASLLGYHDVLTDIDNPDDGAPQAQWDWSEPAPQPDAPALAPLSPRGSATPSSMRIVGTAQTRDTTNAGAFVQFEGARYFSSGRALVNDPQRFTRVGDMGGASVYRAVKGEQQTIYVEAVPGGALAPYTRR